jgi:large subunit ribosomal protein L24
VSAHLSKELKKQYNRRSIPIRKGDEITIKRGDSKGKSGKVSRVDMKNLKVFMDNLKTKKVSGQEIEVPVEPSNTVITKLNLDDKERIKILQAKKVAERK